MELQINRVQINRSRPVLPVHKIVNLEQAKLGFKLCNGMLPTTLSKALLTDHMSASIEKKTQIQH